MRTSARAHYLKIHTNKNKTKTKNEILGWVGRSAISDSNRSNS